MHGHDGPRVKVDADGECRSLRILPRTTASRREQDHRRAEKPLDERHVAEHPGITGVVQRAAIREPEYVAQRPAWCARVHCRHGVDLDVAHALHATDVDAQIPPLGNLHRLDVVAGGNDLGPTHAREQRHVRVVVGVGVRHQNRARPHLRAGPVGRVLIGGRSGRVLDQPGVDQQARAPRGYHLEGGVAEPFHPDRGRTRDVGSEQGGPGPAHH